MREPIEQIDLYLFKVAFPTNTPANLIPWIEPIKLACREFGINTVREVASLLANVAVESRDLKDTVENLNYSAGALRRTFGKHRISDEQCARYGRSGSRPANQRMIANILYGGEWGRKNLGNIHPDDGWNFRGRGIKQITGRHNYQAFANAVGISITQVPHYLETRSGSARAAGWFWKANNLDAKAATPGVVDDRKAINGGTLGLALVQKRFNSLVKELLRRGC